MEEDESSEGDGRIELFQRQARRRLINRHVPHQSTDTTASLPEYTSSPPSTGEMPPKYPQLTAEEADEERDEVGDVVRRVRLRRKRSGSDSSYLDSLLARSVHALELSNALLQSTMTTQSSLSALLSRDDHTLDRSLDSHARFLASQIHASDTRRAWVDDLTRQLDTLDGSVPPSPMGLSQSLPDAQNGFLAGEAPTSSSGLQRGDRPRSPPPRCMTVYADTTQPPDSILIPSTNGLRSVARVHDFVPKSRNHSRQSSVSVDWEDSVFARQQQGRTGWRTPPRSGGPRRSASINTHSSRPSTSSVYQHGNGNVSSPQLYSPRRNSSLKSASHAHLPQSPVIQPPTPSQQQQFSSHQPNTPVRPVLSSVPAEPSTPAYNLLSAIATRSPSHQTGAESDSGTRTKPDPRVGLGLGLGNDTGTVRGRGGSGDWESRLRRTRSATPSAGGSVVASPLKLKLDGEASATASPLKLRHEAEPSPFKAEPSPFKEGNALASTSSQTGTSTSSPARSKPPSRSESTTSSVPTRTTPISSPNRRAVRHPFLQPAQMRGSVSDTEGDSSRLQRYKSAEVLRRILDVARQKAEEEAARKREEEAKAAAQDGTARGRTHSNARSRPPMPTWSVIPRKGTTVAVETVAGEGMVSIQGITAGGSGSGRSKATGGPLRLVIEPDPLVLPGEFSTPGGTTAGSSALRSAWFAHKDSVESPSKAVPVRSQSAGPATKVASLLSASLPKISMFGKGTVGEPPPEEDSGGEEDEGKVGAVDKGKGKAVDESTPIDGPPKSSGHGARLSVQLNGLTIDTDAPEMSSDSENESQQSLPSHASLPLPARLRLSDSTSSIRRPSSLRLPGSPRPSLKQPGSGASTPRSVTFSPLPPKHVPSGGRPLSEAKTRRKKKDKEEKEKPGWFASWFGPLPSPSGSGASIKSGYGVSRRGWDSPRSMDDWQM